MDSKKIILLLMGIASVHASVVSDFNCQSHTFVPRGIATDLVYIDALTFYDIHHRAKDKKFTYVGQTIFQQSRKSKGLGAAFLTGGSNEISVLQSGFTGAPNTILAANLALGTTPPVSPFSATFSIEPQRKIFAYHGYFYANLSDWWCGLWFDAAFAIINARHNLHCAETGSVSTLPCSLGSTIGAQLSGAGSLALSYSKFFCGGCDDEKRRTGFDDLQLRLGYDWDWCDNLIGFYVIGTVPGGRKPTAEFVFEPLVGTRHASVGVGLHGDYQIDWCGCQDSNLTLMTDVNYRYVFSHKECRTFDLLPQGPFSRYFPVQSTVPPFLITPGVNVLTEKVNIIPRSTIQWWLGLNYEVCNWDFEIGYNLWWRQKEKIKDDVVPVPANTAVYNVTTGLVGPFITEANIDVNSGLAGRALTNKVYGAASWNGCICDGCFDWMAGVGGSYEFVSKHDRCSALQNWALFGKAAVSF